METIHAALLEAGSRIAPLASLDEIAGFFQAAAAIGPTAPARATAVAQRLGGSLVDAASMLASILPTLPSMPNVERLLSVLPPCQDMHLGPTRDTCAVCDNGVLEPSQCFTTAPLISAKGLVKQVQLFKRRCSCCHADHYLSYAAGGLRLQRGEQVPYEGCTDARYFHITTSCVWEASLLVDFEAQALNSHTGFSTFMAEYRMKYGGELPFSDDRAHRAFAHAFYAWSLLRWRLELGQSGCWDMRTQNPKSGIRNPDGSRQNLCERPRDIRTQNPKSGIRNPDRSRQNLCERPRDIRTQNPKSGIRNPDRSRQNLCERPRDRVSEPKTQNPESGIQTAAARTYASRATRPRDIRTQNPKSGIRNPDRSRQNLWPSRPTSDQGTSEPKTQNPESGIQTPALY
jgi:hypothetical protein